MKTKRYKNTQLDEVVEDLKSGLVISIPTDTVNGLIGRCDSLKVLEKMRDIKNREEHKAFPVMVSDENQLAKIVQLNNRDKKLVRRYFPGAITFIFNKTDAIPDEHVNGYQTLAVRIPDDPVLLEIVTRLGEPVFLTSANLSGQKNTSTHTEVLEQLDGRVDGVMEGESRGYLASTIIDASAEELKLIREGSISLEEIEKSLEE